MIELSVYIYGMFGLLMLIGVPISVITYRYLKGEKE